MPRGIMVLLFDEGQLCEESWELPAHQLASMDVLRQIAQARRPILAKNVRIVQLKAKGCDSERVDLRGSGEFCRPWTKVTMTSDFAVTRIRLRGIPKGMHAHECLTPQGRDAFTVFSKILKATGATYTYSKRTHPIGDLQPSRPSSLKMGNIKPATQKKLIAVLGEEEALRVWKERKDREKAEKQRMEAMR